MPLLLTLLAESDLAAGTDAAADWLDCAVARLVLTDELSRLEIARLFVLDEAADTSTAGPGVAAGSVIKFCAEACELLWLDAVPDVALESATSLPASCVEAVKGWVEFAVAACTAFWACVPVFSGNSLAARAPVGEKDSSLTAEESVLPRVWLEDSPRPEAGKSAARLAVDSESFTCPEIAVISPEAAEEEPGEELASRSACAARACSFAVLRAGLTTAEAGAVSARLAAAASKDSGVAVDADAVMRASVLALSLEAAVCSPLEDLAFESECDLAFDVDCELASDFESVADLPPSVEVALVSREVAGVVPEVNRAAIESVRRPAADRLTPAPPRTIALVTSLPQTQASAIRQA
jgi:hypothetical protein